MIKNQPLILRRGTSLPVISKLAVVAHNPGYDLKGVSYLPRNTNNSHPIPFDFK